MLAITFRSSAFYYANYLLLYNFVIKPALLNIKNVPNNTSIWIRIITIRTGMPCQLRKL
jgi:hypothetical protein